ncbi:MAG: SUMF1/EgtB/PvdO family nonheme iron enzyme [bacterium]|nr:SUMF1/EgtB/PvdO family nonheme iron enzyme [bacterium]
MRHLKNGWWYAPSSASFALATQAGVLDEYAPLHYGFVHLGLQEYLAALHIAAHGPEMLDELRAHCGDEWWREVVLLLVGLPGRRLFAPLMERLLRSVALLEEADLVRACLEEAVELDPQPFLAVLDEPESPQRQAAVLRLLHGRTDPQLLARAAVLAESADRDVAALARQMVGTANQQTAPGEEYDVFLVHHPAEQASAAELGRDLVRQAFRVVETAASMAKLRQVVENTRGAALLVGPSGQLPWEEPAIGHWLRLFAKRRRALVPVLLPGSGEIPPLPGDLPVGSWIDFRRGVAGAGVEELRRALAGPEVAASAVVRPRRRPAPGETFTELVTAERLLWIPGGRFQIGGDSYDDERPIHWVRISPFWLAETPVTNGQYALFLKHAEREEPEYWRNRRFSGSEQPVVGVSWEDAMAYCRWLSETSQMKFVLPTEAQWEFAARGTGGREYPWGNEKPDSSRACYGLDWDKDQPSPVGAFPAGRGPFGVLDQAGNVWEWCLDAWDDAAYEKRAKGLGGEEAVDPCVEGDADSARSVRGGGWSYPAEFLRAAYRSRNPARYRNVNLGFRVAVAPASP